MPPIKRTQLTELQLQNGSFRRDSEETHAILDHARVGGRGARLAIRVAELIKQLDAARRAVSAWQAAARNALPLTLGAVVEVRRYADLGDAEYERELYTVAALHTSTQGVLVLGLERGTEAGKTEVLRIRVIEIPVKPPESHSKRSAIV